MEHERAPPDLQSHHKLCLAFLLGTKLNTQTQSALLRTGPDIASQHAVLNQLFKPFHQLLLRRKNKRDTGTHRTRGRVSN